MKCYHNYNGIFTTVPSRFAEGEDVLMIAPVKSTNRKTGNMVQLSFLSTGQEPHTATKTGADQAVCGDCPQRPCNGGGCYVVTCKGPLAQYRAWKAERYVAMGPMEESPAYRYTLRSMRKRHVRIGAYGDPGSVALSDLKLFLSDLEATNWTGYTHAWRDRPDLKPYCMASVDSEEEYAQAKFMGWHTFRAIPDRNSRRMANEITCPNIASQGKIQCNKCMLCNGLGLKGGSSDRDIVVPIHGAAGKKHTALEGA